MEKLENKQRGLTITTYIGEENRFLYFFIKRAIDVIISLLGLAVLSPLFLVLSLIVKKSSEGSVFFAHKRVGYKGKDIEIYKFRTMVVNAEELLYTLPEEQKKEFSENFKLENDPRITKTGHFLRRTSLDELPQLLNILKGDLSIVGPRPVVRKELELYGKYTEKFLSVKPGLTGFWQVNGRSNTTYEERVKLDMKYIDNRSVLMDIKIILKTFTEVFKGNGAK